MKKSIFITGASGTGKSTTLLGLTSHGYRISPNHITRPPRPNEVDGLDAFFISEAQFIASLKAKLFFESTQEEAFYGGIFYGSPVCWEKDIYQNNSIFAATPYNVNILSKLCERLTEQGVREKALWINLFAPLYVRRARIESRVEDRAALEHRLHKGVSHGQQQEADLNIDTSLLSTEQVVDSILFLANK